MGATTVGRSLKTARAVLHVLKEMESSPRGLTTEQVAALTGKSEATATYLLNSLVVEGFARRDDGHLYRPVDPMAATPSTRDSVDQLTTALLATTGQALYRCSGERAYVGRREGDSVAIHDTWGRQGQPLVPGLDNGIADAAHALAMGKALLAHLTADDVEDYVALGLRRFTPSTITDPSRLSDELATTAHRGVAVNIEEFAIGFVGLAAPVIGPGREVAGVVAISLTRHKFDATGESLVPVVRQVAERASSRLVETVDQLEARSTRETGDPSVAVPRSSAPYQPETHNTGEENVREER